ncbi:MAG: acyltransferase family protein [Bacteroidaceae bacterium]|nr:acyltransferase family protein [Bacteroidaceae bacterium]
MVRQNWIDWMKAIGMLLIVWGHCFPEKISPILYAFDVPVFLAVSGYLSKIKPTDKVFWQKLTTSLIIPYLIFAEIKVIGPIFQHISDGQWIWPQIGVLLGFNSIHDLPGCGNLWFLYSLILIKIIHQYFLRSEKSLWIAFLVSIICLYAYNRLCEHVPWAVTSVFACMPYYIIGCNARTWKGNSVMLLVSKIKHDNAFKNSLRIIIPIAFISIIAYVNGPAYLYRGEYGNFLILALIAAMFGCYWVIVVSALLDRFTLHGMVYYLSIGSVVILAFHRDILHPFLKMIDKLQLDWVANAECTFLLALATTIVFIPIIYIIKRYVPFLIGNR